MLSSDQNFRIDSLAASHKAFMLSHICHYVVRGYGDVAGILDNDNAALIW